MVYGFHSPCSFVLDSLPRPALPSHVHDRLCCKHRCQERERSDKQRPKNCEYEIDEPEVYEHRENNYYEKSKESPSRSTKDPCPLQAPRNPSRCERAIRETAYNAEGQD